MATLEKPYRLHPIVCSRGVAGASEIKFAFHQREIESVFGDVNQPFSLVPDNRHSGTWSRKAPASSFMWLQKNSWELSRSSEPLAGGTPFATHIQIGKALGAVDKGREGGAVQKSTTVSHFMKVGVVVAVLVSEHGEALAHKKVLRELQNARRARSRKRYQFWVAVAAGIGARQAAE